MRALLLLSSLTACQAQGDLRPAELVLRDARDAVELTLTRTATGCVTDDALVIVVGGDRTTAGAWTLAPGATSRELRGPAGLLARIVDEPGATPAAPRRLSLIDPVGVPLVRLGFAATTVTVTDAARAPVGTIASTAEGFVATAGERRTGRVTGTADLEVAARLLAPTTLPLEARALFACDRLTAVTPAAK